MGIVKAKSAKEINEEIKAKRNPAAVEAGDNEPEVQDAPIGDENTNDAGAEESSQEAAGSESADNDGASDPKEEDPGSEAKE